MCHVDLEFCRPSVDHNMRASKASETLSGLFNRDFLYIRIFYVILEKMVPIIRRHIRECGTTLYVGFVLANSTATGQEEQNH